MQQRSWHFGRSLRSSRRSDEPHGMLPCVASVVGAGHAVTIVIFVSLLHFVDLAGARILGLYY